MERRVPVRVLNQQTSAILAEVAEGHAVTITSGGKPVARLVGIVPGPLDALVAEGIAVGSTVGGPISLPDLTSGSGIDVAAAMASDREQERW